MKNKNRLLKILLFSVLIIASLVTYLSYGVKEKMTSTKLDFDNNRSRITEILTSKSILLDMKIQRRKGNYDLLHYYVKGDDIDQLNVYDDYSLKDVFTDYIYNLEDENNHETKGIKYYVYDKTDEKIFFTNSKKNLKKAFETQDKTINGMQPLIMMKMEIFLLKEIKQVIGRVPSIIHPLINFLRIII